MNPIKSKKLIKKHKDQIHLQNDLPSKSLSFHLDVEQQIQSLFPQIDESKSELIGKYLALDCEFVGIGPQGKDHALARVSIVNFHGKVLFDSYVKPKEKIIDYRTEISGITYEHIKNAPSFLEIQTKVCEMILGRIVIGHGLRHDFKAMVLNHPRKDLRDTAQYAKFRSLMHGKTPSLKFLAGQFFGLTRFQEAVHSSVQDAQVAMLIYRKFKSEWEASLSKRRKPTDCKNIELSNS